MFPFHPTGGPGNGLFPMTRKVTATARVALSNGELVMFDLSISDGKADNLIPGSSDTDGDNSGWNTVINPSAEAIRGLDNPVVFGLCQDAAGVADDGLAEICYFGFCQGLVIDASGSPAIGDPLVGTAGANLDAVVASGEIVIAAANEALTTPTTATLGKVFIWGTLLGTYASTAFA